MDLHDGRPFWPTRDGIPDTFPPLKSDTSCDVAVVGAGITGALVALELHRRGLSVVVLDRRDAGTGSTSASTALLQYEIDELLIDLADTYGFDAASWCYRESARGIDLVARAAEHVGALSGFRRSPSILCAIRRGDITRLQRELTARADAGFGVSWLDDATLADRWGMHADGAIESVTGGSVDPFALAYAALCHLRSAGQLVVDRTTVTDFEFTPRRVRLRTDRDCSVTAKWCVIATGYEVERLLPDLAITLNSSFAFVSEPIPELLRRYPDGLLFWDFDDPYLYGRTTDDERVLIGGRDERYRDPQRRRRALATKVRALERDASRRLPEQHLEVGYAWAGTFAETPDGLPYIGSHPSVPRCRFALGFGGNGITYSALSAEYIASELTGSPVPGTELFRLDRPVRRPS